MAKKTKRKKLQAEIRKLRTLTRETEAFKILPVQAKKKESPTPAAEQQLKDQVTVGDHTPIQSLLIAKDLRKIIILTVFLLGVQIILYLTLF